MLKAHEEKITSEEKELDRYIQAKIINWSIEMLAIDEIMESFKDIRIEKTLEDYTETILCGIDIGISVLM